MRASGLLGDVHRLSKNAVACLMDRVCSTVLAKSLQRVSIEALPTGMATYFLSGPK